MKLSEFLDNKKIECPTDLIKENWERLLNSDERVLKQIDEWEYYNLIVDIGYMNHADSYIRSPKDKGYQNYFYDGNIKMYVTYELTITRNLTPSERRQYGNAIGISMCFDLPLSMWITVLRSDIQKRISCELSKINELKVLMNNMQNYVKKYNYEN